MRARAIVLGASVLVATAASSAVAAHGDVGSVAPPGGAAGATGVTGAIGATGLTGPGGATEVGGATGATGVTGITGDPSAGRVAKAKSTVDIVGRAPSSYGYSPQTVSVRVGDTVVWDNRSSASEGHTVTGHGLDSGTLKEGDDYSFKFHKAGTYKYTCEFHPSMKGTVNVKSSGGGGGGGGSNGGNGGGGGDGSSSGDGGTSATGDDPSGTGSESAGGSSPFAGGTSSQLPLTGFGVPPLAAVGGILLLVGLILRLPAVRDRLSLL